MPLLEVTGHLLWDMSQMPSICPPNPYSAFCPALHPGKPTCGDQIKDPLASWLLIGFSHGGALTEPGGREGPQTARLSLLQAILKAAFSTGLFLGSGKFHFLSFLLV